jgi:hypothetical protein
MNAGISSSTRIYLDDNRDDNAFSDELHYIAGNVFSDPTTGVDMFSAPVNYNDAPTITVEGNSCQRNGDDVRYTVSAVNDEVFSIESNAFAENINWDILETYGGEGVYLGDSVVDTCTLTNVGFGTAASQTPFSAPSISLPPSMTSVPSPSAIGVIGRSPVASVSQLPYVSPSVSLIPSVSSEPSSSPSESFSPSSAPTVSLLPSE